MFRERACYLIACDVCGKEHEGTAACREEAERAACDDRWQAYTDSHGIHRHRCPWHWTARCVACGRTLRRVTRNVLAIDGWVMIDGRDAICPDCRVVSDEGRHA